jgi:hypothetical protein
MSRRKKSSKLIPILFAVLIIFLAVLVVNNYLTYQAFQESERQYQDFQQQLIEDAMNEEVVEETQICSGSENCWTLEDVKNNNPHIMNDGTVLLLDIENPRIDYESGLLTFDVIQDEEITGPNDVMLNNGELRMWLIPVADNEADVILDHEYLWNSYQSNGAMRLENSCISGCDQVLIRSTKYSEVRNKIVINLSKGAIYTRGSKYCDPDKVYNHWCKSAGYGINLRLLKLESINNNNNIKIYVDVNNGAKLNVSFSEESLWLSNGILSEGCKSLEFFNLEGDLKNVGADELIVFDLTVPANNYLWESIETTPFKYSYRYLYPESRRNYRPWGSSGIITQESNCPEPEYTRKKLFDGGWYDSQ